MSNIHVFDVEQSQQEMATISALGRERRISDPPSCGRAEAAWLPRPPLEAEAIDHRVGDTSHRIFR